MSATSPGCSFPPKRRSRRGMGQAREQCLDEQLVPHSTVKTLGISILHRPARRNVIPHTDLPAPCQLGIAGEFRAVVADDPPWRAALSDQRGEFTHDTTPEIDVSGTAARHSLFTSSTTISTWSRLPDAIWSLAKLKLQRWFGRDRTGAGALVLTARFRLRRLLTASPFSL